MLHRLLAALALACVVLPARADTIVCKASWYGPGFHGRATASGEIYDQNAMTAAHKALPFGTRVRVTWGRRSVVVTITDRGPFKRGRCIDISLEAAKRLGMKTAGVVPVTIEVLR